MVLPLLPPLLTLSQAFVFKGEEHDKINPQMPNHIRNLAALGSLVGGTPPSQDFL